jgi:hypothetical protein
MKQIRNVLGDERTAFKLAGSDGREVAEQMIVMERIVNPFHFESKISGPDADPDMKPYWEGMQHDPLFWTFFLHGIPEFWDLVWDSNWGDGSNENFKFLVVQLVDFWREVVKLEEV